MSAADNFLKLFDEQGRYKNGDGEVGVIYLTRSGTEYPGKFRFKNGLLVGAEMVGAGAWGSRDESPLDGLKFLLQFQGEKPRAVFVEQGRVVHNFEVPDRGSKEVFLANFRVARNLFSHPRAETDSPIFDPASISDALTRGALWLTPNSVAGFNPADFPELKADRQTALQSAVQAFKAIASQVPAGMAPTKDQYGNAAGAFIAILNILRPYVSDPEESRNVERALRNVQFPPWVVNWDYELGTSEDGDAAVWVNVFAEGNVARSDYGRFGTQIIPMIREALEAEGVRRWPYIRLRTAMEFQTA
jgi:hypothetical protein